MTQKMGYSQYTKAKQEQIDRLQTNADRLFSIRRVRDFCQAMSPSDSIEYSFARNLVTTFESVKNEILKWGKGCLPEYLLQGL